LDPVSLGVIRIEVERTISSLKNVKRERTRIDSFKNGRAENDVGSRILADSPDDNSQRLLMIDEKLGKPENGGLTHSTKYAEPFSS